MSRLLIISVILAMALPAVAATIHVARDGSGDFSAIQPAVDAAASGDTIVIGPGRYNEGAVVTSPGWTDFVRVLVRQNDLTLVGAGAEQTIIGPATPWNLSQGWNVGIEAGPYWGCRRICISGIGFENMAYGVKGASAPESVTIQDCRFFMNEMSLTFAYGGSVNVSDCVFDLMPRNDMELMVIGMQSVEVVNCQFNLASEHLWRQQAVHLQSTSIAVVTGCTFRGGDGGLALFSVPSSRVADCVFSDQTSSDNQNPMGVYVSGGTMSMANCVFDRQTNAIFASNSPSLDIVHTQILDASVASLNFDSLSTLDMHQCILAHGSRYAVWQEFPCDVTKSASELPHLDMTNNDWGTSNADSIAAWIRTCEYAVDFVPFIGQPVSAESTSWGDLKASFR